MRAARLAGLVARQRPKALRRSLLAAKLSTTTFPDVCAAKFPLAVAISAGVAPTKDCVFPPFAAAQRSCMTNNNTVKYESWWTKFSYYEISAGSFGLVELKALTTWVISDFVAANSGWYEVPPRGNTFACGPSHPRAY
jgi:hypothetical protein